jgi:hypothetical protein
MGREEDVVRLFDEIRHRHPEHHARRTPPRRGPGPAPRGLRLRVLGRRTGRTPIAAGRPPRRRAR